MSFFGDARALGATITHMCCNCDACCTWVTNVNFGTDLRSFERGFCSVKCFTLYDSLFKRTCSPTDHISMHQEIIAVKFRTEVTKIMMQTSQNTTAITLFVHVWRAHIPFLVGNVNLWWFIRLFGRYKKWFCRADMSRGSIFLFFVVVFRW